MRTLLLLSALLGASLAPTVARADVQSCLAASEKGQRARAAGKLREAREAFLVCGADACPALVRQDCARWADDVANRMPSVVIGAKDRGGRDVSDVKVFVDETPLVHKLDGKSIPVDPGLHTFRFETAGMPPVTEKVLVKEGDRAKPIEIVFDGGAPPPGPPKASASQPTGGDADVQRGAGALPWVVFGLGAATVAAGGALYLAAPAFPEGCDPSTKKCTQGVDESAADFQSRQDRAGKHDGMQMTGLVAMGAGGVVALTGLVWYVVASSSSGSGSSTQAGSAPRVSLAPWLGNGTTGLSAAARF